ncbi:hypothetical protein EP331_02390 [bacterium]|nr:MAG: hypothetical protein EP331_02390 [bacterium]
MFAILFFILAQVNPIVFFLGGQSNMDGDAKVDSALVQLYELPEGVHFWENGEKLTNPAENRRIGPEYSVATELKKIYPNREIWLIKRALGGVSLYAWSPKWTAEKADSTKNAWAGPLYSLLMNDFKLISEHQEVELGGMFWMQGERDAKYEFAAKNYFKNVYELVTEIRKETKPNLPFVLGLVNPPPKDHLYVLQVRNAQRQFAEEGMNAGLVQTDDLSKNSDQLHYSVEGQKVLGERFVQVFDSLNHQSLPDWNGEGTPVSYWSDADESLQKAMIHKASGKRPLIMVIHTWRGDWKQWEGAEFLNLAKERNWHFIHPDNRGANDKPEAVGSEIVMKDMEWAVRYMQTIGDVDTSNMLLLGMSGGGFASLNAAARIKLPWKAVSVWVPISDLAVWHQQSLERKEPYADLLEKATGGKPGETFDIQTEYEIRSPLTYLKDFKPDFPIHIHVGIHDGHTGSVPVSHSLLAYNALSEESDRFTDEEINYITQKELIPKSLKSYQIKKEKYGKWNVLLRRNSGNVTLTIFDGTHSIDVPSAYKWLDEWVD